MKAKIKEDCKTVFSKVMSFPIKKVSDKSNAENVENWDSLTHVQLVSALEKKFKIRISAEEGIDAFNNFKQLVSFVEKKLKIK
jgi:acyl carrier protein